LKDVYSSVHKDVTEVGSVIISLRNFVGEGIIKSQFLNINTNEVKSYRYVNQEELKQFIGKLIINKQ
jgi:hypothetical protein